MSFDVCETMGQKQAQHIEAYLALISTESPDLRFAKEMAILRLLGLRDADVDAKISACLPVLCGEGGAPPSGEGRGLRWSRQALEASLADKTVGRCRGLGLQSYRWLSPSSEELPQVVEDLMEIGAAEGRRVSEVGIYGAPSLARLVAYEFCRGTEDAALARRLLEAGGATAIEVASLARSLGQSVPAPRLAPRFFPSWETGLPQILCRDPMTCTLSLAALAERPWALPRQAVWVEEHPARWTILIDVDDMKHVNDRWGMSFGHTVLLALSNTIHLLVGDRCLRRSGDRWLIIFEGEDGPGLAREVVEAVAALHFWPHYGDGPTPEAFIVTVSAGVSLDAHLPAALEQAEAACRQAKVAGKNRVSVAPGQVTKCGVGVEPTPFPTVKRGLSGP